MKTFPLQDWSAAHSHHHMVLKAHLHIVTQSELCDLHNGSGSAT